MATFSTASRLKNWQLKFHLGSLFPSPCLRSFRDPEAEKPFHKGGGEAEAAIVPTVGEGGKILAECRNEFGYGLVEGEEIRGAADGVLDFVGNRVESWSAGKFGISDYGEGENKKVDAVEAGELSGDFRIANGRGGVAIGRKFRPVRLSVMVGIAVGGKIRVGEGGEIKGREPRFVSREGRADGLDDERAKRGKVGRPDVGSDRLEAVLDVAGAVVGDFEGEGKGAGCKEGAAFGEA